MGPKYAPLSSYLASLPESQTEATLTFGQIEAILGARLPPSARSYQAWWANQRQGSHVEAAAWLDAGWEVDGLNLSAEQVRLTRRRTLDSFNRAPADRRAEVQAPRRPRRIGYDGPPNSNENDLVEHIAEYYNESVGVLQDFGGPSIYFHVQAIHAQHHDFMSHRHLEMIYATLASWGMHRMGDPDEVKAKMVDFAEFRASLLDQKPILARLLEMKMHECSEDQYLGYLTALHPVYASMRVSISQSTLVSHAKVLAHILPDLIPPIDRQYTVRFFTQDHRHFFTSSGKYRAVVVPVGAEEQFDTFVGYALRIKRMFDRCDRSMFHLNPETFNTSYPKIMDNVIMAFVKSVPAPLMRCGA